MGNHTATTHALRAPHGSRPNRKRVGRGPSSGYGKTSTAGQKGQSARSGGGVRLGFEGGQMPLYRRIAHRGFSNAAFRHKYKALALTQVAARFSSGEIISPETLRNLKIVKGRSTLVKIVSGAPINIALCIVGVAVTQSVKEAVIKAGGTIESVTTPQRLSSSTRKKSAAASRSKRTSRVSSTSAPKGRNPQ